MTNKNDSLNSLEKLYQSPFPSTRKGPLYNAFSFPTKISPESIALFIATHTSPGAHILDVFGGSGSTGLATLLCDRPTPTMQKMASEMGLSPVWGPRKATIYELGVLGSYLSKTMCSPPDIHEFEKTALQFLDHAQSLLNWVYEAKDNNEELGTIRHIIWSDVLICPNCDTETTLYDATVRWNPLCFEKEYVCKTCNKTVYIDHTERQEESVEDYVLRKRITQKKRVPVVLYGETNGRNWKRHITQDDLAILASIENEPLPNKVVPVEIYWGDLYRRGYHKGITHLHHFYTKRNFLVLSTIWELVNSQPKHLRDYLKLLILSYNSSHSTLMSRVVAKKNQSELVLTGAQSGVLYISGLPVEKNIFKGLRRKVIEFKKAFETIENSNSTVEVINDSSDSLHLANSSVDYIFTDPPFGDYIPYSEINQINEAWLGQITNREKEAIISRSQNKDINEYSRLITNIFKEMNRVLKTDGKATIAFHSAHADVWNVLTRGYQSANLQVKFTSILDKIQSSFKQTNSNISVKGDPLILLTKESSAHKNKKQEWTDELICEVLTYARSSNKEEKFDIQRLYSQFISRCLELNLDVPLDANTFYKRVKAEATTS